RLALATDSGGAGYRRGGLGYLKEFRVVRDSSFLCVADRAILSCWGLRGGKASAPFKVTVDPGGPHERLLPRPVDGQPLPPRPPPRARRCGGGAAAGGGGAPRRGASRGWGPATCSRARSARAPRARTTAWCWRSPPRTSRASTPPPPGRSARISAPRVAPSRS